MSSRTSARKSEDTLSASLDGRRSLEPIEIQNSPDDGADIRYIGEMAISLAQLAKKRRLEFLSYLLEMSAIEADKIARDLPLDGTSND